MMHPGGGWAAGYPSKDDCATAEGRGPGRNEAETGWKCLELGNLKSPEHVTEAGLLVEDQISTVCLAKLFPHEE